MVTSSPATLVTLLLAVCLVPVLSWSTADEATLKAQQLTDYDSSVRPSNPTEITVGFFITSVNDVNLNAETWSISGWYAVNWNDPRLVWTPASHGTIDYMFYKPGDIWTPTMVPVNSVEDGSLTAINDTSIWITAEPDGACKWRPPSVLELTCDMITTYFPYDRQECSLDIVSFGYTTRQMNITSKIGFILNADYFSESGEFEIIAKDWSIEDLVDGSLQYGKLKLSVTIQRLASAYWFGLLFPLLVNAFLIPLVFLLPPSSGEKMGFSLTVFLTFMVLLTLVTDSMSTSSKTTALVEVYITIVLFSSVFSVFFTTISVLFFNKPETENAPSSLHKMCHYMKIMMLQKKTVDSSVSPDDRVQTATAVKIDVQDSKGEDGQRGGESEHEQLSYQEVSSVLDAFLLRVYMIVTVVLTVIFMFLICFGASAATLSGSTDLYI